MTFAKLSENLPTSSLWSEKYHVRIVFITFLSIKDENGVVVGVRSALQRLCNVTIEEYDDATTILSSPDPESKTKEFEGRRIAKCDDGWIVLNHEKYRLPEQEKAENRKEYMKNYMKEYRSVNSVNNGKVNSEFTSVSISDSVSVSKSLEECRETFLKEVNAFTPTYPAAMLTDFIDYWTEKNQTGKKMRFQMEKTWDTHKRLARWARNNKDFLGNKKETQEERIARICRESGK